MPMYTQHPGAVDELYSLRDRERKLQEELLQSQKENMQLRFEFEQAIVELPRLKVRTQVVVGSPHIQRAKRESK